MHLQPLFIPNHMKNHLLFVALTIIFLACKPEQSDRLTAIQYKAQTRGYSLTIEINPTQILRIENEKKTIINLTKTQWESIETSINAIDFSTIQNKLDKELAAVDRVIPAQLTIIKEDKTQLVEFTHNATPSQLKPLLELIQVQQ